MMPEIFATLRADRPEIDRLFDAVEAAHATDDFARTGDLFVELTEVLFAHLRVERQVVYPTLAPRQEDLGVSIRDAGDTHDDLLRRIEELAELSLTAPRWPIALAELRELVGYHLDEDEYLFGRAAGAPAEIPMYS